MKALELLYIVYKDCKKWEDKGFAVTYPTSDLNQAIKELEELQNTINTVIEEIDYALAKPEYAEAYLNNALRFLKEGILNGENNKC